MDLEQKPSGAIVSLIALSVAGGNSAQRSGDSFFCIPFMKGLDMNSVVKPAGASVRSVNGT